MSVNELLRAERTRLGLAETEVARRAGLSLDEYRDVEQHEDEPTQVLHLRNLRLLCSVLRLDPLELVNIPCAFCAGADPGLIPRGHRHAVVRARRLALGISPAELANRIGFEAKVVDEIERNPDYMEDWSVDMVVSLANVPGVPPQDLINLQCPKCGR